MRYIQDFGGNIRILFDENSCDDKLYHIQTEKTSSKKTYKISSINKGFFSLYLEHDYSLNGAESFEIIVDYYAGTTLKINLSDSSIKKKLSYGQTLMISAQSRNTISIDTYEIKEL